MTRVQRSQVMSRNWCKDTVPERYIHTLAAAAGMHFKKNDSSLPGTPDLVFMACRLVVFVDGDFWHGWRFPVWRHRLTSFWQNKIARNRTRDERNYRTLRRSGWRVMRLWEHQIEDNVIACVERIAAVTISQIDRSAMYAVYATMPKLKRRKRLPKP